MLTTKQILTRIKTKAAGFRMVQKLKPEAKPIDRRTMEREKQDITRFKGGNKVACP